MSNPEPGSEIHVEAMASTMMNARVSQVRFRNPRSPRHRSAFVPRPAGRHNSARVRNGAQYRKGAESRSNVCDRAASKENRYQMRMRIGGCSVHRIALDNAERIVELVRVAQRLRGELPAERGLHCALARRAPRLGSCPARHRCGDEKSLLRGELERIVRRERAYSRERSLRAFLIWVVREQVLQRRRRFRRRPSQPRSR